MSEETKSFDMSGNESQPSTIKYCLLSAFAVCCTAVFAVIGISLVTQKRFEDISHNALTITGIFFLSLTLLSCAVAIVMRRIYKRHYYRHIMRSHGSIRPSNTSV